MEFMLPVGSWEKIRRRKERLKEIKKKKKIYLLNIIGIIYG